MSPRLVLLRTVAPCRDDTGSCNCPSQVMFRLGKHRIYKLRRGLWPGTPWGARSNWVTPLDTPGLQVFVTPLGMCRCSGLRGSCSLRVPTCATADGKCYTPRIVNVPDLAP
eukprot:8441236-Alexandrium_andersonii.AAC.1